MVIPMSSVLTQIPTHSSHGTNKFHRSNSILNLTSSTFSYPLTTLSNTNTSFKSSCIMATTHYSAVRLVSVNLSLSKTSWWILTNNLIQHSSISLVRLLARTFKMHLKVILNKSVKICSLPRSLVLRKFSSLMTSTCLSLKPMAPSHLASYLGKRLTKVVSMMLRSFSLRM